LIREEFDMRAIDKRIIDARLHELAAEIERLTIELHVGEVIEQAAACIQATPEKAVFMEMI